MIATLCLHHNDADGRASGAVVRYALGHEIDLIEIDYGDPVPWEAIRAVQRVVIVDFSLPRVEMERIAAQAELIWIDHHISAIQEMEDVRWSGLRDISEAACILCWKYFFPQRPAPRALVLIGDRDIWRLAEPDSGAFNEGLHHESTHPLNDTLWYPLLADDSLAVEQLVQRGRLLLEARLNLMRRQVKRYAYPVIFEGYSTLAINRAGEGDMGHYMLSLGYEIAYCYLDGVQNGLLTTFVTLYSDGVKVDVSALARKHGGGGHRGAAGFSFARGDRPFPK
jgi:oligoribonuclease NrnB/cAMP/cGMP phosphodiesterase (DHH superfamily)